MDADHSIFDGHGSEEVVWKVNFAAASELNGRDYPVTTSIELWLDAERFNEHCGDSPSTAI